MTLHEQRSPLVRLVLKAHQSKDSFMEQWQTWLREHPDPYEQREALSQSEALHFVAKNNFIPFWVGQTLMEAGASLFDLNPKRVSALAIASRERPSDVLKWFQLERQPFSITHESMAYWCQHTSQVLPAERDPFWQVALVHADDIPSEWIEKLPSDAHRLSWRQRRLEQTWDASDRPSAATPAKSSLKEAWTPTTPWPRGVSSQRTLRW